MPPKDADPLMLGGLEPEAIVTAVNDKKAKKKPGYSSSFRNLRVTVNKHVGSRKQ